MGKQGAPEPSNEMATWHEDASRRRKSKLYSPDAKEKQESVEDLISPIAGAVSMADERVRASTAATATATAPAAAATAAASSLVAILSNMPRLTAIIASSTATKPTATPSPPSTSPSSTIEPESSTIPPAARATAASAAIPVPSAAAAAAAASALDVGSVGPGDVDCLGAAVIALGDQELDDLSLGEGTITLCLDGRLVDEDILTAVVRRDEAEPLGAVEPLHRAPRSPVRLRHRNRRNPNPKTVERKLHVFPPPLRSILMEAQLWASYRWGKRDRTVNRTLTVGSA
ncbi:hypothetical protein BHE74_00047294 [Ensete ventricosum]|nr:hypothetical protein BHE74_00047294 [Ensete ventricosum]